MEVYNYFESEVHDYTSVIEEIPLMSVGCVLLADQTVEKAKVVCMFFIF
jgi:hypothetical protein